jgi:hypothetical protein
MIVSMGLWLCDGVRAMTSSGERERAILIRQSRTRANSECSLLPDLRQASGPLAKDHSRRHLVRAAIGVQVALT